MESTKSEKSSSLSPHSSAAYDAEHCYNNLMSVSIIKPHYDDEDYDDGTEASLSKLAAVCHEQKALSCNKVNGENPKSFSPPPEAEAVSILSCRKNPSLRESQEENRIEARMDRGQGDCSTTNDDNDSFGDDSFESPPSPCKDQRESSTKPVLQPRKSIGTSHTKASVVEDDSCGTKAENQHPKPPVSLQGEDSSEEDEVQYDSDIAQLLRTDLANSSGDSDDDGVDLSELGRIMADIESEEETEKEHGKKDRKKGGKKSDNSSGGETSEDDENKKTNAESSSSGKCETTIFRC